MIYTNIFTANNRNSNNDRAFRPKVEAEDEDEYSGSIKMFNKPTIVNEVDAYLDGPIRAPYYYRNMLQYLRQMEKEDICRIWINTYGGRFDSTQEIIGAMQQSEGKITAIISGSARSAGSMIALSAPQLIVSDKASMMIHTASFGSEGKVADVFSMVEFTKREIEQTIRTCYDGFLSQDELKDVFASKEMWFNSEEIVQRLKARAEYQKANLSKTIAEAKVQKIGKKQVK